MISSRTLIKEVSKCAELGVEEEEEREEKILIKLEP